jgi:hypothetical protein
MEGLNEGDCVGLFGSDDDADGLLGPIIGGGFTTVDACSSADFDVSIQRPVFASNLS